MGRKAPLALIIGLAAVSFVLGPGSSDAELYLSPNLQTAVGYTSNRFLDEDEVRSAYLRLAPGLEAYWFPSATTEVDASVVYQETRYLDSEAERSRDASAQLSLSHRFTLFSASLGVAAGIYEDEALPGDDSDWVQLSASVSRTVAEEAELSVAATVSRLRYPHLETTDGGTETATAWALRPGAGWSPNPDLRLWAEVYAEGNETNEDLDDYRGAGFTAGADTTWTDTVRVGLWGQRGWREYPNGGIDGDRRRDESFSWGGWAAWRLTSWAELTAAGSWLDYRSDEPETDYRTWTAETGVRLIYDWEVPGTAD